MITNHNLAHKIVFFYFIFNISTNVFAQDFKIIPNYGGYGSYLQISKQENIFALQGSSSIEVWDAIAGKQILSIKASFNDKVLGLNDDGTIIYYLLYMPNSGYNLCAHNIISNKLLFTKNYDFLNHYLSNNKDKLIVENRDSLLVFDCKSGMLINAISKGNNSSITESPDGDNIISYSEKTSELGIRNIKTKREIFKVKTGQGKTYTKMCTSSDLKKIAITTKNGIIDIFDVQTSKLAYSINTNDTINNLFFNPTNEYLAVSCGEERVKIYNSLNGQIVHDIVLDSSLRLNNWTIASSDNYFALSGGLFTRFYSFKTGHVVKEIGHTLKIDRIVMNKVSPNGKFLMAMTDSILIHWDLETLTQTKLLIKTSGKQSRFLSFDYMPDSKGFIISSSDGKMEQYEFQPLKLKKTIDTKRPNNNYMYFITPDGKYVTCAGFGVPFQFIDLKTGKIAFTTSTEVMMSYVFSKDLKYFFTGDFNKNVKAFEYETGKEIYSFQHFEMPVSIALSRNGKLLAAIDSYGRIIVADYQTGKEIARVNQNTTNKVAVYNDVQVYFSDNSSFLVYSDNKKNKLYWDTKDWKQVNQVGEKEFEKYYAESPKFTTTYDNQFVYLFDNKTNPVCHFMSAGNEWLCITSDGLFESSNRGGELISIVKGLKGFSVDQFAVNRNRPDLILKMLGSTHEQNINYYNKLYQKRLKRLGLSDDNQALSLQLPNSQIVKAEIKNNFVTLQLRFSDDNCNLQNYNVFINDVPIFGALGKQISGKELVVNESLQLSYGENKIEVSCLNSKGIESYRALTIIQNAEPIKKNLYLLAFGVSKYQNPTYNLQFADKDAIDLAKVIDSYKGKGFENVYTKVLTNEQVTPDAIKASKDFVKDAKPDDTFILFIAGHGMHDSDPEATYYYLTSNADIKNLKGTAADFETIEDLLQGIPPRNKLFLMDACESGEIDEEDQGQMLTAATGVGIASRGFKNTSSQTSINEQQTTKRSYLYQKDRYIYNDLVRRSGAIVFSSSKGGELSYERSDIQNGLFTEYIMKALTTNEADKDGNGTVSTDELRAYVSEQVSKASGDLQHPTVDRDNIYQKFGFKLMQPNL